MSLESTIAALVDRGGAVLDLPEDFAALALAKIADIGAAYAARIASMGVTRYVAPITGSDTANSGLTNASPYKTLQKAIADCPRGGLCSIFLMSDITLTNLVEIDQRYVLIRSDSSVKRAFTFDRYYDQLNANEDNRGLKAFIFKNGGSLNLRDIRLNMPVITNWDGYPNLGRATVFGVESYSTFGHFSVALHDCQVDIPSNPFGTLLRTGIPVTFMVANLVAITQPILGRLHASYTNTSGTATKDCPDILTNLTSI